MFYSVTCAYLNSRYFALRFMKSKMACKIRGIDSPNIARHIFFLWALYIGGKYFLIFWMVM